MTSLPLINSPTAALFELQIAEPFYYSQDWLNLITKLYGYSYIPLTVTNSSGRITGFLPLYYVQSGITGPHLVSLPFSDRCPMFAEDQDSADNLIDQAIRLAQKQKARYLELRSGTSDVLAQRSDLVEENLYVRWLKPLSPDPDSVWSNLRKPIQRQIKKSQNLGVQVRIAQHHDDVMHYYQLHLHTRCKKYGMPAQPRSYFFELWDTFAASGVMKLLLAEYQGTVIAGMILLASGTTLRYTYGASDERYLKLAPNNLLMWTSIKLGCTQGYQTLDMGRTACENEGLMEFKRRWGAIKEPLPYYYYPKVAGLASTSETSRKYHLLTSCWKRLPLQVAGPLGSYIYKHLG